MKRGTPDHPKTQDLAARLGLERWGAVGILECLWHFAATYAKRGDVGRHTDAAIAKAMGWTADPARLMDGLVGSGWLERCRCHRLRVHDWPDHVDQTVQRSEEWKKHGPVTCYGDASSLLENSSQPLPLPLPLPEPKPLPKPAARAAKQQAAEEAKHGEDIARFETAFRRSFRRPRASLPPHKHAVFAERLKGGYPAEFLIGLPVAAVASGLSRGRDVQPEFLLRNGAGHYSRGGETRTTFDWLGAIWQSADKLTIGPDQAAILSDLGILEWWTTRGAAVHSTAADEC